MRRSLDRLLIEAKQMAFELESIANYFKFMVENDYFTQSNDSYEEGEDKAMAFDNIIKGIHDKCRLIKDVKGDIMTAPRASNFHVIESEYITEINTLKETIKNQEADIEEIYCDLRGLLRNMLNFPNNGIQVNNPPINAEET